MGRNGSGKSLLVNHLTNPKLFFENIEDKADYKLLNPSLIAYVSFDSHLKLLKDDPHRSVYNVITGGSGNLSKSAQYLVVRFGMFPLLYRTVSTLSTGVIRKTLLIAALCQDPKLLILENAFDGLDVKSRMELKSIVSKTIQGLDKSGKLLIQQVQANNVRPAQILMSTHRPEEIVDEVSTVSMSLPQGGNNSVNCYNVITIRRPDDFSQERLMYTALGLGIDKSKEWSEL